MDSCDSDVDRSEYLSDLALDNEDDLVGGPQVRDIYGIGSWSENPELPVFLGFGTSVVI